MTNDEFKNLLLKIISLTNNDLISWEDDSIRNEKNSFRGFYNNILILISYSKNFSHISISTSNKDFYYYSEKDSCFKYNKDIFLSLFNLLKNIVPNKNQDDTILLNYFKVDNEIKEKEHISLITKIKKIFFKH